MRANMVSSLAWVVAGFGAGIIVSNLPRALAADTAATPDLAHKRFMVSLDEIKKDLVFGDEFTGRYSKTLTLSDGTTRTIELTPMLHDGMQVIEIKDTGGHSYMDLNGTTIDGRLMIQVRDLQATYAELRREGWRGIHKS